MMKVTLMPNFTREKTIETTLNVCNALKELDIDYAVFSESLKDVHVDSRIKEMKCTDLDHLGEETDIIITIGGDGTMIRASKFAVPYDIPILGVNAGSLAFLMGLDENETHLLSNLLTGNYTIEERLVLKINVFDENRNDVMSDYCINDVVFARGREIKIASLDVYCDDRFVNRYDADGLVVSTPTGSSAYNLSVGGPVVDPGVESVVLSPICSHSLVTRTIIFSCNSILKIVNPGNRSTRIVLSCDGGKHAEFKANWGAVIRKADKKVKFIHLKDDSFTDILYKKMKYPDF